MWKENDMYSEDYKCNREIVGLISEAQNYSLSRTLFQVNKTHRFYFFLELIFL